MAQAEKKQRAVKEFWAAHLDEDLELALGRLRAAINGESIQNAFCPRCRGRVEVRGPDVRAVNDAIKTYHELAGKRPRQDVEDVGGVTVQRTVVVGDDGAAPEPVSAS